MNANLVSVVIANRNHEKFLKECIDSVLAQTYADFEVIVIDDGSTDGSLTYLKALKHPKVQLYYQDHRGPDATINRGLTLAKGEFIAILNADDLYAPNRLETFVAFMRANPKINLLASWMEVLEMSGNSTKTVGVKEGWKNMPPWALPENSLTLMKSNSKAEEFACHLIATNFVSTTSNIFMRRTVFETVGGMRKLKFAHDWDFLLRTALKNRCALIEQPLLKYRVHPAKTAHSDRAELLFEICWIWAVHLQGFEKAFLLKGKTSAELAPQLESLYHSINAQGLSKIVWLMRDLLDLMKQSGKPQPEVELLTDSVLRATYVKLISQTQIEKAQQPAAFASRGKSLFRKLLGQ